FDTDYDDICYFAENTYACSDYLASGAVACIGEAYYQPPSLPAGEPFVICGSGGAGVAVCPYPLPSGSVVRDIPAGALTYFEASADTYTGFNLPPGTWYVSETDGDFAKVWIACQASPVWVPTANIVG